jgi:hypothetical protein
MALPKPSATKLPPAKALTLALMPTLSSGKFVKIESLETLRSKCKAKFPAEIV